MQQASHYEARRRNSIGLPDASDRTVATHTTCCTSTEAPWRCLPQLPPATTPFVPSFALTLQRVIPRSRGEVLRRGSAPLHSRYGSHTSELVLVLFSATATEDALTSAGTPRVEPSRPSPRPKALHPKALHGRDQYGKSLPSTASVAAGAAPVRHLIWAGSLSHRLAGHIPLGWAGAPGHDSCAASSCGLVRRATHLGGVHVSAVLVSALSLGDKERLLERLAHRHRGRWGEDALRGDEVAQVKSEAIKYVSKRGSATQ